MLHWFSIKLHPWLLFAAPSAQFEEAINSQDLEKAKDILHDKFKDQKIGDDEDARKFVDFISKQSVDLQKTIYKSAPVNFFRQYDSKKQTTFHNLAAFQQNGVFSFDIGVEILEEIFQGRLDSDVIALRKILTQKENGTEPIKKVGKTAITQLEEIAKAQNLDKPIYITIEEKSGPVKNERNSSQTSTVTYYCKIECKFNGNTFEGEAGHKNILIKTNASKKNEAKNLAAEKALQPYDQVDASVNIQTTKKIKTPLGIAIYFNNIIFIGGCISTVYYPTIKL